MLKIERVNVIRWKYRVKGYDAFGSLLLETQHKNKTSMEIEVLAWLKRFEKNKDPASYCEVIDFERGTLKRYYKGDKIGTFTA